LGITGRIVDADVKEASVGGAPLESTGEEAVVNNEATVGDVKEAYVGGAPLESTGEEAVVYNEAAVVAVKEVSHEFTEEETVGDNKVVANVNEASVCGADLETSPKEGVVDNKAAVVDGEAASVGGAPIAVAEDMADQVADVTEASVAGAHVEASPVEAMGDDNVLGNEASVCAAVIKVTQEEHLVENVAFGSVAVEVFFLESTSETNTDSSAADDRGNSIDQMATTNRSLRARKNGKVLPKSDGEVIDLEAMPSSTFNESHRHFFIFPASMSGETKLNSVITSEFVDAASVGTERYACSLIVPATNANYSTLISPGIKISLLLPAM
jgi:hypothetical protein